MATENDLRAALAVKADHAPALDPAALIRDARQPRHRPARPGRAEHRLQLVAASVAVLTVIGGASVVRSVQSGGHGTGASTMPSTTGPFSTTPVDLTGATPQSVAQTLMAVLGIDAGSVTHLAGHGGINYAADTMTYNDGNGAALLYVTVTWPHPVAQTGTSLTPTSCTDTPTGDSAPARIYWATEPLTCTTLADGTDVGVGQPRLPATPGHSYGLALNNVSVLRPDGTQVSIGAFNQATLPTAGTPSRITRADPPFTTTQLTATARSAQWTPQVPASAVAKARNLFTTPPQAMKKTR